MKTTELGERIKAEGTKADKIAWGNTIQAIRWADPTYTNTNKGRYIDERF